MREVKYLSPSSLNTFETDKHEFFYNYLADTRLPRQPQTEPMSVGSAFDAYVKSALYTDLFGKANEQFEFTTLFEMQVEEHNRDFALEAGQYTFDCYKETGAYAELLEDITAGDEPQFEFTVRRDVDGVVLLGKPDCLYTRHDGFKVLLDWKVNGYCSKSTTSPAKNFKMVIDAWTEDDAKPSRNNLKAHKNYEPKMVGDYEIGTLPFEEGGKKWADQVAMYLWTLGEPVGSPAIVAVDQLACKPHKPYPLVRVAQHRGQLSVEFQEQLFNRLKRAWDNIQDGYIFTDMTREDNDNELAMLNNSATCMGGSDIFSDLRF